MLVTLSLCLFMIGCEKILPDSYVKHSDAQYFQSTAETNMSMIQLDDTGCYLYHDGFIYYYDNESSKITPLCSKANCLHDRESSEEKLHQCNAYLDNKTEWEAEKPGLFYYEGDLYVLFSSKIHISSSPFAPYDLYRISGDGSSKDKVATLSRAEFATLHRGYLYYYGQGYNYDGETGVDSEYSVRRISVSDSNPKEEIIFALPKGSVPANYTQILAYGNYIYFSYAYTVSENGNEKYIHNPYYYNIHDKTTGILDIAEKDLVSIPDGIFNDRLLFKHCDQELEPPESYFAKVNMYSSDFSGEDIKDTNLLVEQAWFFQSDGKYLYVEDVLSAALYGDKPKTIYVYDSSLNLVDFYTPPATDISFINSPIGNEHYQYLLFDEDNEWGIYVWEKSGIGTYHGSTYDQKRVVYQQ